MSIVFEEHTDVLPQHPLRMDVACFVGFIARRSGVGPDGYTPLPAGAEQWLRYHGWQFPDNRLGRGLASELLDVPVPIESWEAFDALYAWDERPVEGTAGRAATWMGGAVRSFFQQGGRRCYVIRVADPTPLGQAIDTLVRCALLVPGYPHAVSASPHAQSQWRGVAHVHGLADAALLVLPDLPELFARVPPRVDVQSQAAPDMVREGFVECSAVAAGVIADQAVRVIGLPRCDEDGYRDWARAIRLVGEMVRSHRLDMQLLAALPLPQRGSRADGNMLSFLEETDLLASLDGGGVASAFVQLAYPWLIGMASRDLPGGVVPPDAALAGLVARTTLARGSHRSCAGEALLGMVDTLPRLGREQQQAPVASRHGLIERVSLFGPTPAGLRCLSDVTSAAAEAHRLAAVTRIIAALVRSCQQAGLTTVFEPSGPVLWRRVREGVERLLERFLAEGALHGTKPRDAFAVRCDRSTMTQNDLDHGRVVVEVSVQPAAPIERITVSLALSNGGPVSLHSAGGGAP